MNIATYYQTTEELLEEYKNNIEEFKHLSRVGWLADTGLMLSAAGLLAIALSIWFPWALAIFWFFTFPIQFTLLIFRNRIAKMSWVPFKGSDIELLEFYEAEYQRIRTLLEESEKEPNPEGESQEGRDNQGLQEVDPKDSV